MRINNFKLLRYFCLALITAAGFITIVATGGDSDGDDDNNNNDIVIEDDPCNYGTDISCDDKYCLVNSGRPDDFLIFNDKLLFSVEKGCQNTWQKTMFEFDNNGEYRELFQFDNFSAGSVPYIICNAIVNDEVYFSSGTLLYRYDGYTAEPAQIASNVGTVSSLMAYNNKLYYTHGSDWNSSCGFYSYDGTESVFIGNLGVASISAVHPGYTGSNYIVYNGMLYFSVYSDSGWHLWRYDEEMPELHLVDDGMITSGNFVIFQDNLFYSANDGVNGAQLWMIDGENPPEMVTDLPQLDESNASWIKPVTVFNGKLLCVVADNSVNDSKLLEYDGINYNTIPGDYYIFQWVLSNSFWAILNEHFYFIDASDGHASWGSLWDYDGINPPKKISTDYIYRNKIYTYNDVLLLEGTDKNIDTEEPEPEGPENLSIYDGISEPKVSFDLSNSGVTNISLRTALNENYFLTGTSEKIGDELWKMDNTGDISLVNDFYPGVSCSCE